MTQANQQAYKKKRSTANRDQNKSFSVNNASKSQRQNMSPVCNQGHSFAASSFAALITDHDYHHCFRPAVITNHVADC